MSILPQRHLAPETAGRVASVRAIPLSAFHPDPRVAARTRDRLIERTRAGEDVYAYQVGPEQRWVVWIGCTNAAVDARHTPAQCVALCGQAVRA